jgi:hypothetical protein
MALGGCGTLGERVSISETNGPQPQLSTILGDLQTNSMQLKAFKSSGLIFLESPHFDGTRSFRSNVLFRKPADLYVQGRQRPLNVVAFRMLCVGKEFVMEFPKKKDESYYQVEGEEFEDVPYSVSPSDIAREMFFPEDWDELKRRQVRMLSWDAESGTALLEIGPKRSPRRRIEVGLTDSQPERWVLVSNELLNEKTGERIALTLLSDYTLNENVYFPALIDAVFPTEETGMKFKLRNIRVNAEIDEERFDLRGRVEKLGLTKG